ncbi:hypothetical protein SynBIOSE41_00190 [Synechococcus sp. BIOS-E4-1]|nr:hypothetical protein SynBIOSE41_00190 [Synechococcus sp. BIOS-E4-1]
MKVVGLFVFFDCIYLCTVFLFDCKRNFLSKILIILRL